MPALVAHIAVDLDELLEDRGVAADAFRRETRAVVEVAVDVSRVLVVRVLRAKNSRANRTREMLNMIFFIYSNGSKC